MKNIIMSFLSTMPNMTTVPLGTKALLFMSGFGILSIEILGSKILSPYVGTTLPVWAAIIGIALMGGIVGYYAGGTIADTRTDSRICICVAVFAGIAIALIPALRGFMEMFAEHVSYTIGALLGSFMLFFIPITLLSTLITYVIRVYVTDMNFIGQVHGDLYTIATYGSIIGVFGTSYLLVPFFTIPHILYGLGISIPLFGVWASRTLLFEERR